MGRWATGGAPRPGSGLVLGPPNQRAGSEGRANRSTRPENMARPRSPDSQSEAGGQATRRHSNQLNLLPLPRPSNEKRRERPVPVMRNARPHPAQQPVAQQRTDKDIPWGTPQPIARPPKRDGRNMLMSLK